MDGQAFRRERMLASGLLREVSSEEAMLLNKGMEAYLAQGQMGASSAAKLAIPQMAARPEVARGLRPDMESGSFI